MIGVRSVLRSIFSVRPYASFLAKQLGYELVGENGNRWSFPSYKLFSRGIPEIIKIGREDPYDSTFKVDITEITSRVGFSYAEDGWHPFLETLKEYIKDPNLQFQDSTLARLYQNYRPTNVQEVILDHIKKPLKPFCDWPPTNEFIRSVWTLSKPGVRYFMGVQGKKAPTSGWIFYGPHDLEYGEREFRRLINVYESIKKVGYNPGLSTIDPVNGYLLKRGNDFRFVLLQGNHRVTVLKALGYKEVDVVIRKGHPAIVDHADLYRWTTEGGGMYSSDLVENLFNTLFFATGLPKAKRYGLSK